MKQDIKEIRDILTENTIKLAEYNSELRIHIAGTNDLRARVRPLEDHTAFVRSVTKFVMGAMTFCASCAAIWRYLH